MDILASAIGYAKLLTRHIDKENDILFSFAKRSLDETSITLINNSVEKFEDEHSKEGFLLFLEELEKAHWVRGRIS